MEPDLLIEFDALRDAASQLLQDVPASGSYRRVFSFWKKPSFRPPWRCVLYAPLPRASSKKPFASFTTWRSDVDQAKFRTPLERLKHPQQLTPTIEEEVLWLEMEMVEKIESQISGIEIPLIPSEPSRLGCDGTSFEFEYSCFSHGLFMRWWEESPEHWRPFTSVVCQIANELDSARLSTKAHSVSSSEV